MKKIIAIVVAVAIAAAGVLVVSKGFFKQESEHLNIEAVLEDASILTTQTLTIKDVFEVTQGKIPLINKSKYLVYYETTVYAGFDVSEVTSEEKDGTITVYIPHCTIDEETIKIASDDIKLFDTNLSIFKANKEKTLEIIGEAEDAAREFAKDPENGFLEAADKNAKLAVKDLLEAVYEDYEIVVKFK